MPRIFRAVLCLAILCLSACSSLAQRRAEHVIIVSFDGGKPSVMRESKMPELNDLVKNGAVSWEAQTTFPSITLVSHTSMLTGVGPEKHGVNWNDWIPSKGLVTVPTIFGLASKQGMKTAMFVNKPKFKHFEVPGTVTEFSLPANDAKGVAKVAAAYIEQNKPDLTFVHFADGDSTGHHYGWGSRQQVRAFADADRALKTLVDAVKKAGIADSTVIIVTADHGGHEKTHGTRSPEDMTIPWLVWGKGVKPGHQISAAVTTYDTAATALWLLDVPIPSQFDGKPVTTAFDVIAERDTRSAQK
jgi:predicted AlkP superfamily pyrophosphatase or phosphodiesterase